jgi:pimeloyl-ACP methyl ester carboxylesterase
MQRFAQAQLTFIRNAREWSDVAERLAGVETETLILWGAQGWATAEQRAEFTASLPNADSQTLDGCGHFIAMDCPEAVLAALLDQ